MNGFCWVRFGGLDWDRIVTVCGILGNEEYCASA